MAIEGQMGEEHAVAYTGSSSADRRMVGTVWESIALSVWNMHDAVLTEQRRTNQLLEALLTLGGGSVPEPNRAGQRYGPHT